MNANKSAAEEEAREDIRQLADAIEYFDTHDLGEELENMPEVHFEINLPPRRRRYSLDNELSQRLEDVARQRGVSAEALLNEWVQEKAAEILTVGAAE